MAKTVLISIHIHFARVERKGGLFHNNEFNLVDWQHHTDRRNVLKSPFIFVNVNYKVHRQNLRTQHFRLKRNNTLVVIRIGIRIRIELELT